MTESVKPGRVGDARKDRWNEHRDQRRREFVEAALRALESGGPELLMEAVAVEAGVSKPVLYRYFSDKAELVTALAERGSEVLLARMLPAINSGGPVLDRIAGAVGAYFEVIDEHPKLYWLTARHDIAEAGDGQEAWHPDKESIANALAAVMAEFLRTCGLDCDAAEPWAHGVTGLVQATGEWWLRRRTMSRPRVVGYVTELIWAALTGVLRPAGIELDPGMRLPPGDLTPELARAERA